MYKKFIVGNDSIKSISFNDGKLIIACNNYIQTFEVSNRSKKLNVTFLSQFPNSQLLTCKSVDYYYCPKKENIVAAYDLPDSPQKVTDEEETIYFKPEVPGKLVVIKNKKTLYDVIFIPKYGGKYVLITYNIEGFNCIVFICDSKFTIFTGSEFITFDYPTKLVCGDISALCKRPGKLPQSIDHN